jgi:tetraacyldisaccharide 4'-kinase
MRHFIISHWYRSRLTFFTLLLLPFSFIFWLITILRQFCYRIAFFKKTQFAVPVIVVGNITVGGTGKTPLVIWLAKQLIEKGYRPGVIIRGYGVSLKQPKEVLKETTADEVGDEAVLIKAQVDCPVFAFHDRVIAARTLLDHSQCNVIISDDGLQHYALARDVEIAVIDGVRGLGNGFCLPAGPLRELASRLKTVDFVVVNNGNVGNMGLMPETSIRQVSNPQSKIPLSDLQGEIVHAIAGIGHPQRFFDLLKSLGLTIIEYSYPDHHFFSLTEIDFKDGKKVIMTEKDAVKCATFSDERHWFLPIEVKMDDVRFLDGVLGKLEPCNL